MHLFSGVGSQPGSTCPTMLQPHKWHMYELDSVNADQQPEMEENTVPAMCYC